MTVQMRKFVRSLFERCFQVRDSYFWIAEGIGLTGFNFYFRPQKQIPSGSCEYDFLAPFSLPREILTNFNVFGLDLI
jgi:hypothetical protein